MGFTIEEPRTLDDALEVLAGGDETVRAVGGGTGLALLMKYGFFEPTTLVSLRHLQADHSAVEATPGGGLRLGSMATLRDLERAPSVASQAPLLHQALQVLATVRLRNVAQLGGAIAHGHPQMDTPAVLLATDAQVHVANRDGDRWIDAGDLFLGYYETAVADDELITEVVLPPLGEHRASYRKVTARAVDDWPMLGVAVVDRGEGEEFRDLRVAVGALTERAQRLSDLEESLDGTAPNAADLEESAAAAAATVEVHDTPAASASYQRHLVAVHIRRALTQVLAERDGATRGSR